ncbi:DnaA N-terminal domain-containing protein [Peribacillus sp. SI8-4]
MTLAAPTELARDWLENRYGKLIQSLF